MPNFPRMEVSSKEMVKEEIINLTIRDTAAHDSSIVDTTSYSIVTIFVKNGLDQKVDVQAKGNESESTVDAVKIGEVFHVEAEGEKSRSLSWYACGWLPFIFVTVTADQVPTSGNVIVYAIKKPII